MSKFTFTFGSFYTYTMFEATKKDAINRFIEELGAGVPFHVEEEKK